MTSLRSCLLLVGAIVVLNGLAPAVLADHLPCEPGAEPVTAAPDDKYEVVGFGPVDLGSVQWQNALHSWTWEETNGKAGLQTRDYTCSFLEHETTIRADRLVLDVFVPLGKPTIFL